MISFLKCDFSLAGSLRETAENAFTCDNCSREKPYKMQGKGAPVMARHGECESEMSPAKLQLKINGKLQGHFLPAEIKRISWFW